MNPATLTTFQIVVALLSLLGGIVTTTINSGKVAASFTVPASWLVWLNLVGPFVAGATASLTSAGVLTASSLFSAVVAGLGDVFMGVAPGGATLLHLKAHAHLQMLRELRKVPAANDPAPQKAVA